MAKSDLSQDVPEEGAMTGLTVTDRETGKSVDITLSLMEAEIGTPYGFALLTVL